MTSYKSYYRTPAGNYVCIFVVRSALFIEINTSQEVWAPQTSLHIVIFRAEQKLDQRFFLVLIYENESPVSTVSTAVPTCHSNK